MIQTGVKRTCLTLFAVRIWRTEFYNLHFNILLDRIGIYHKELRTRFYTHINIFSNRQRISVHETHDDEPGVISI